MSPRFRFYTLLIMAGIGVGATLFLCAYAMRAGSLFQP